METSNVTQCMNELLQLYVSDVQPRLQLATAQAMYVALDKCSDVVHITDQNLNVQVNTCAYNVFISALDWV
jgi:high affinity cAMP-specific and IBMX-insensitive 3',5'-cyclic phosphodiesterase 8